MEKQSGFYTPNVTDYYTTNVERKLGIRRWLGNKCYRWVLNSTGVAITIGGAYFFGVTPTGGTDMTDEIYTLGQSGKGTAINLFAGIGISTIPIGGYGWIQCEGQGTAQVEGTSAVAASDNLKGVSGQIYLVKDTAAGTAPGTAPANSVALAAKGTAGTANTSVLIRALS